MSDADLYRIFKTLHVLAVALLAGGITVETLLGPLIAKAPDGKTLKVYTGLSRRAEMFVILPAIALIPIFGYAAATRVHLDLGTNWLLLGQIFFWAAAAIGVGYLARGAFALDKAARSLPDGELTPDFSKRLKSPLPPIAGALLTVFFVFIVYLMVAKPGW